MRISNEGHHNFTNKAAAREYEKYSNRVVQYIMVATSPETGSRKSTVGKISHTGR